MRDDTPIRLSHFDLVLKGAAMPASTCQLIARRFMQSASVAQTIERSCLSYCCEERIWRIKHLLP
jgi:hypothetical protein